MITMKELDWHAIRQLPGLVKGQIEVHEEDKIYRGEIKEVFRGQGHHIYFDLLWCAHYDLKANKWIASGRHTAVIFENDFPLIIDRQGAGRQIIITGERGCIFALIFLEGSETLLASEVEGLDLNNLPQMEVVELG